MDDRTAAEIITERQRAQWMQARAVEAMRAEISRQIAEGFFWLEADGLDYDLIDIEGNLDLAKLASAAVGAVAAPWGEWHPAPLFTENDDMPKKAKGRKGGKGC